MATQLFGGIKSNNPDFVYDDVTREWAFRAIPTVKGGVASGGDVRLQSTSHATKGKVHFGAGNNNYYDETLDLLNVTVLSTDEAIHVAKHGAVGDGSTDDTVAIQAAFTAAAVSGGTVVFGLGLTYKCDENLFLHGNVNIQGNNATLLCNGTPTNSNSWFNCGITKYGATPGDGIDKWTGGVIADLTWKAGASIVTTTAVWLHQVEAVTILRCHFDFIDCGTTKVRGIAANNDANWCNPPSREDVTITHCTLEAAQSDQGTEGISLSFITNGARVLWSRITGFGDDAIGFHTCEHVWAVGNYLSNVDGRLYASSVRHAIFANNYIERMKYQGTTYSEGGLIWLEIETATQAACADIVIADNVLKHVDDLTAGTYGIRLRGVRRCSVVGNVIYGDPTSSYGKGITLEGQQKTDWTDPEGIDQDDKARIRDVQVSGNVTFVSEGDGVDLAFPFAGAIDLNTTHIDHPGYPHIVQVLSDDDASVKIVRWGADANPARFTLSKSRGAAIGTNAIVVTGDDLGTIEWSGDDGVDLVPNATMSAQILVEATGTIAADRVPTVMSLWTATDAAPSVLTKAVTIDALQNVGVKVVPEADWDSAFSVIRWGGQAVMLSHTTPGAGNSLNVGLNTKYDGAWKHITTGAASLYAQTVGTHIFYVAPSANPGDAVSLALALKIDNSRNVLCNNPTVVGNLAGGFAMKSGTPGSSAMTDAFQLWSADASGGGTACPYFYTEDQKTIKLYQQAHVADADASHTITDPVDTPASADALRDDLVTNAISEIRSALDALGAKINVLIARRENQGFEATS